MFSSKDSKNKAKIKAAANFRKTSEGNYLSDNRSQKVIQRAPVTKEEAQQSYDSLGSDKWMELIDSKDHAKAHEKAHGLKRHTPHWTEVVQPPDPDVKHPGEYYDYQWGDGHKVKKMESFKHFIQADAFVKSRIGKKMSTEEYMHIQKLAYQPESDHLKGLREKDVTWGLPKTATPEQLEQISAKGMSIKPEQGRYAVTSPHPKAGIEATLSQHFRTYHENQASAKSDLDKFHNIIELYQHLEALHAFKDGTSRTNHLVLNKLLSEHGLGPTILHEPNSPMYSKEEFGKHVLKGIAYHKRVAAIQGGKSKAKLEAIRKEHIPEAHSAEFKRRAAKMGLELPELPEFKPPEHDPDVLNQRIDLDKLLSAHEISLRDARPPVLRLYSGPDADIKRMDKEGK